MNRNPIKSIVIAIRREKEATKPEILLLGREILSRLEKGKLSQSIKAMNGKKATETRLKLLLNRQMLGDSESDSWGSTSPCTNELFTILEAGIKKGTPVANSLRLFCERLEYDIKMENRLAAKTRGMRNLTYAGLVFFLPLSGGISSSILSASLSVVNSSSLMIQQHFLMAIGAYIIIALYIGALFDKPGSSQLERLRSVIPLGLVSMLTLYGTSHYIGNLL